MEASAPFDRRIRLDDCPAGPASAACSSCRSVVGRLSADGWSSGPGPIGSFGPFCAFSVHEPPLAALAAPRHTGGPTHRPQGPAGPGCAHRRPRTSQSRAGARPARTPAPQPGGPRAARIGSRPSQTADRPDGSGRSGGGWGNRSGGPGSLGGTRRCGIAASGRSCVGRPHGVPTARRRALQSHRTAVQAARATIRAGRTATACRSVRRCRPRRRHPCCRYPSRSRDPRCAPNRAGPPGRPGSRRARHRSGPADLR